MRARDRRSLPEAERVARVTLVRLGPRALVSASRGNGHHLLFAPRGGRCLPHSAFRIPHSTFFLHTSYFLLITSYFLLQTATVTRRKVAGIDVTTLPLFCLLKSSSCSFCRSAARPFFSAASKAFMVGP